MTILKICGCFHQDYEKNATGYFPSKLLKNEYRKLISYLEPKFCLWKKKLFFILIKN